VEADMEREVVEKGIQIKSYEIDAMGIVAISLM